MIDGSTASLAGNRGTSKMKGVTSQVVGLGAAILRLR
jgi:hypothetical protein